MKISTNFSCFTSWLNYGMQNRDCIYILYKTRFALIFSTFRTMPYVESNIIAYMESCTLQYFMVLLSS